MLFFACWPFGSGPNDWAVQRYSFPQQPTLSRRWWSSVSNINKSHIELYFLVANLNAIFESKLISPLFSDANNFRAFQEMLKSCIPAVRYEKVLTLSIAILENGPMLNNRQRSASSGKDKTNADEARQIMKPLAEACLRPYFWDALQALIRESPTNLSDKWATRLPPQYQTFLPDDQIERLVRAISKFNINWSY